MMDVAWMLIASLFMGLAFFNGVLLALRYRASRRQMRDLRGRITGEGAQLAHALEPYQRGLPARILLELAHAVAMDRTRETMSSGRLTELAMHLGSRKPSAHEDEDRLLVMRAGLSGRIEPGLLPSVRKLTGFLGALSFSAVGMLLSPMFAPCGLLAGGWFGYRWPGHVLGRVAKARQEEYGRDLPFMLDILSLCVGTGMSFDAAFSMFAERFDSGLARDCRRVHLRYMQGLETREQGLERLAEELHIAAFDQFVETVTQALRFGAPLASAMETLAEDVRKEYRTHVSERIAKAPVRMLIPTGTLILPAMLLLVLGPVILNIFGEMM